MGVVELPPGYSVREFRPEDADAFPGHLNRLRALGHDLESYLRLLADGGCFTVLKDGTPVGCAGIIFAEGTQETAWFLSSEDVRQHPKLHLKIARQFLAVAEEQYDLTEIYATAETQDVHAHRWLEHLGFRRGAPVVIQGQPHIGFLRERR